MGGTVICPGCRADFPDVPELRSDHLYVGAASGCWAAYMELTGRLMADPGLLEARLLSVDAYVAQHPGVRGRQAGQSVWTHLVGLCLALEFGLGGADSTRAKARVAAPHATFDWLEPPASLGSITVLDILATASPQDHRVAVERWAGSVWTAWAQYAEEVRRRAIGALER